MTFTYAGAMDEIRNLRAELKAHVGCHTEAEYGAAILQAQAGMEALRAENEYRKMALTGADLDVRWQGLVTLWTQAQARATQAEAERDAALTEARRLVREAHLATTQAEADLATAREQVADAARFGDAVARAALGRLGSKEPADARAHAVRKLHEGAVKTRAALGALLVWVRAWDTSGNPRMQRAVQQAEDALAGKEGP